MYKFAAALLGCLGVLAQFSSTSGTVLAQSAKNALAASHDLSLPEQMIPLYRVSAPAAYETGVASTYGEGDGFEGNLTACGKVFHTQMVQVAHKSLPCGTMIRIEDADSGRSVFAQVTDRGPYIPGRIVDLSWGAFQQLEPSGPGLLQVTVYLLDT